MNYSYTQTVYGSSYPSSNGFVSPQHGQIRPRVVFDGGNRFVKWIDPKNAVQCLLSVVKEVSEYQWKRLKPDDQSVLIEIDGKRFVIGRLAQELGGEPTFQTDKCQLASILALSAIQPNPGQTSVHIQQM
ncbi:StbA family protein, partial [Nostoc punctiforme UO1]